MMFLTKMHDRIWCYESQLDTKTLIDLVEKDEVSLNPENVILPWHEWYTKSGDIKYVFGYQKTIWNSSVDENILKNSESALANSLKEAQNLLFDSSIHYATHFDLFNISHSSINLSKYIEGKAMGSHIDSTPDQQEKAAMTAILYLNDDYEGGELFFREQKIKLKPKAGTVVIFPSYIPFYHQSFTITKGVKYIVAVFWEKNNDV